MRLGGFGDVAFTLPAVNLLRTVYPDARFTYLVYHEFASLLGGFRAVDDVITLDRKRFRQLNPMSVIPAGFGLLRKVLGKRFDLVVDFQGFGETGLLSWLSRAPQRWGSVYRRGRGWAYTRPVWRDSTLHAIDYHLQVLREGGGLKTERICNQFEPPAPILEEARQLFCTHKLQPGLPTLFIQPFTSSPHKNWPLERFLDIAQHWRERGVQILFGGGAADNMALGPARQAGFVVVAGSPILLSASLVQLSTVVLGGNTGLLHLAMAMDKRVRMIMHTARAENCFPYGHPEWAIIPPSGSPLSAITFDAVNQACAQALAETQGHRLTGANLASA
jgi:ADP-heptose:LPS heptosyltransferase